VSRRGEEEGRDEEEGGERMREEKCEGRVVAENRGGEVGRA